MKKEIKNFSLDGLQALRTTAYIFGLQRAYNVAETLIGLKLGIDCYISMSRDEVVKSDVSLLAAMMIGRLAFHYDLEMPLTFPDGSKTTKVAWQYVRQLKKLL